MSAAIESQNVRLFYSLIILVLEFVFTNVKVGFPPRNGSSVGNFQVAQTAVFD